MTSLLFEGDTFDRYLNSKQYFGPPYVADHRKTKQCVESPVPLLDSGTITLFLRIGSPLLL